MQERAQDTLGARIEKVADLVMDFFDVGQVHPDQERREMMVDRRFDRMGQEVLGHPVADGAVVSLDLAEHDAPVADGPVDQGDPEVDVVNAGLDALDRASKVHPHPIRTLKHNAPQKAGIWRTCCQQFTEAGCNLLTDVR